jgi:hypothetical protein
MRNPGAIASDLEYGMHPLWAEEARIYLATTGYHRTDEEINSSNGLRTLLLSTNSLSQVEASFDLIGDQLAYTSVLRPLQNIHEELA